MFKIAFVYLGYENLGVEYLAANLKKNGFDVRLFFDPVLFNESGFIHNRLLASVFSHEENILKSILNYNPDLVCFSVITDNYKWAYEWARRIKRQLSAPIVFGGIHPTSVPGKVIVEPFVDYVCVGEGDEAIVDLAVAIRDKKSVVSIPNIWCKSNGSIFKNCVRPLISDLDNLPIPDKDLFYSQFPIFNNGYLISTSRGCPFKCSYCCNNIYHSLYKDMGEIIRRRSIDNVLTELEEAKIKYNPKFIHFVDEVFNYGSNWLFSFLYRYKKEINLPFSCYVYPDFVNHEVARKLKEAGCFKVQMGIQVINEDKRKNVLNRASLQKNISEAIDFLKKEKIYITCDSIFGFPDESEKELLSLAYFYHNHTPNHCESFWLRYYPKTEITNWALQNNYIDLERKNRIEDGKYNFGILKKSEHPNMKSYARKFMLLFSIYRFIPNKLRLFILKRKLYRFLPSFSILSLIIVRIFNHPKYDFNTRRTFKRYLYFLSKKLIYIFTE